MHDPLKEVRRYYSERIVRFGAGPAGVDWNDAQGQSARFGVLLEALDGLTRSSLVDLGCGYGALLDAIGDDPRVDRYRGIDVAPEMIEAARSFHSGCGIAHPPFDFMSGSAPADGEADVLVASGIFNVRADVPSDVWKRHVEDTIGRMARAAERTFAYNALLPPSAGFRPREHLHYSDPEEHERLVRRLGWVPTIRVGYGPWEFSIIARKMS